MAICMHKVHCTCTYNGAINMLPSSLFEASFRNVVELWLGTTSDSCIPLIAGNTLLSNGMMEMGLPLLERS